VWLCEQDKTIATAIFYDIDLTSGKRRARCRDLLPAIGGICRVPVLHEFIFFDAFKGKIIVQIIPKRS